MFNRAPRLIALTLFALGSLSFCFAQSAPSRQTPADAGSESIVVPDWLPVRIPAQLYEKWRKYGIWDYKQQGFQYRDFTLFNFGATGSAAGLDKDSLAALAQASNPTPDDVRTLEKLDLAADFKKNSSEFENLLAMAEQDSHLIRIADDYTWLDNDTKWPRTNIGFSNERWKEYRQMFQKLSITQGILRTTDFPKTIFFLVHARGLCTGGSSAGYVYSTKPLSPLTESPARDLDVQARANPNKFYAYVFQPLQPNWYAFYEIDW